MPLNSPADQYENDQPPDKKPVEGVDKELAQKMIRKYLCESVNYRDATLTPVRKRIQDYYDGDVNLSGDLKVNTNRSKFVSRDARDTIMAVMPQLISIFFGNDEHVVQFSPVGPEDVDGAKAATDYVSYLVRKHGGLRMFWSVIMDTLKNKVGAVKYWWNESKKLTEQKFTGLTEDEFKALQFSEDPDITIEAVDVVETMIEPDPMMQPPPMPGMPPMPPPQPVKSIDCTLRFTSKTGQISLEAVPPEERLIEENARSLETTRFWAHARSVPVGELVAMGYDEDEIDGLSGGDEFLTNEEAEKRENAGNRSKREDSLDPSLRSVPYAECYIRSNLDGSGLLSLWRVCVGGAESTILHGPELVDEIDVAEFTAIPVEHVATGTAYAENVLDLQGLRTSLFRGMLDSLSQSLFPQRAYWEQQVNGIDMLNNEPGANIRTKQSPANCIQDFATPFTGQQVLGVLQYTDEVKENRTGTSRNAAGLDPNALQSTTKVAANAVVSGSQRQVEMLARILAEFGFKPLFKGILRLLVKHQKHPERVRMQNNEFAEFDPRNWNPDMDVIVNTALGSGTTEDEVKVLSGILGIQMQLLQAKSPLVDDSKLFNTLDALARLTRYKDGSRFYIQPQPGTNSAAQNTPPDPNMMLAEVEKFKAATERDAAREKHVNERIDIILKDDRERAQAEIDAYLKMVELRGKHGMAVMDNMTTLHVEQVLARERTNQMLMEAQAAQNPVENQQQGQQQGQPQQ